MMTITIKMIIDEIEEYSKHIDEHFPLFNELRSKLKNGELTVEEFDIIFHLLGSITYELNTIKTSLEVL